MSRPLSRPLFVEIQVSPCARAPAHSAATRDENSSPSPLSLVVRRANSPGERRRVSIQMDAAPARPSSNNSPGTREKSRPIRRDLIAAHLSCCTYCRCSIPDSLRLRSSRSFNGPLRLFSALIMSWYSSKKPRKAFFSLSQSPLFDVTLQVNEGQRKLMMNALRAFFTEEKYSVPTGSPMGGHWRVKPT